MSVRLDNVAFDMEQVSARHIMEFEEKAGTDLATFAAMLDSGKIHSGNTIRNLHLIMPWLWLVLRQSQPDLSYDNVLDMGIGPLNRAVERVQAAWEQAIAEQKPEVAVRRAAHGAQPLVRE